MKIYLYTCSAEVRRVNKAPYLNNRSVVNGALKENSSVIDPTVTIAGSNLSQYNYMYIPDFNRYYFINNVINLYNNMWEIHGHVDVLYTYGAEIRKNKAIVDRAASGKDSNLYLDDGTFVTDARKYTQVIEFQHGLNENPATILIAAGGEPA